MGGWSVEAVLTSLSSQCSWPSDPSSIGVYLYRTMLWKTVGNGSRHQALDEVDVVWLTGCNHHMTYDETWPYQTVNVSSFSARMDMLIP